MTWQTIAKSARHEAKFSRDCLSGFPTNREGPKLRSECSGRDAREAKALASPRSGLGVQAAKPAQEGAPLEFRGLDVSD
ncbi:MAG TPA: hypothetical protein VGS20_02455 [Candidatus Acidoferrales bacterium]|nr:hypothetical protein [Candidatus Acidoferrales bacterium]